jgi:hypothetical protein
MGVVMVVGNYRGGLSAIMIIKDKRLKDNDL